MSEPVWCESCEGAVVSPVWPGHDQCAGCLRAGVKPYDYVPAIWTHYDLATCHALVRQKVAAWEQGHPGWQLAVDQQRVTEDSTAPSKYVDRDTTIGRKQVRARFRVVRAHLRGRRAGRWPVVTIGDLMERLVMGLVGIDVDTGDTTVVPVWDIRKG